MPRPSSRHGAHDVAVSDAPATWGILSLLAGANGRRVTSKVTVTFGVLTLSC